MKNQIQRWEAESMFKSAPGLSCSEKQLQVKLCLSAMWAMVLAIQVVKPQRLPSLQQFEKL